MKTRKLPFVHVVRELTQLLADAPEVNVGEWQSLQDERPQSQTIEVEDVSFAIEIPGTRDALQNMVSPNLPWAEEHFQERVSGYPHNPPPSHVRWPFAQQGNAEHREDEKFSHTYPERFWPKRAGDGCASSRARDPLIPRRGLRYYYGDLQDVVELLKNRPGTRQAFLPVWFPEDTGAVHGERVPCTLGYHFMVRENRLKCVYYIRSCDFFRHFRDDVYMAARLVQWISNQLLPVSEVYYLDSHIKPGNLVMHISSLHIFAAERTRIEQEAGVNASTLYESAWW